MLNIFDNSQRSWKDMRHRPKDYQISHYLVNGSDFEIKTLSKIEGFIWFKKGSLLLKHPVYSCILNLSSQN